MDFLKMRHLALIAHHCYGSVDLAARCLNILSDLGAVPEGAGRHYLSSLGKPN